MRDNNMDEPQIVYIEEQLLESDFGDSSMVENIYKKMKSFEIKVLNKISTLESLLVKQNEKIDKVLRTLLLNIEPAVEIKEAKDKLKTSTDDPKIKRSIPIQDQQIVKKKKLNPEPLVVESYEEIAQHTISPQKLKEDTGNPVFEMVKIKQKKNHHSSEQKFHFTNIEKLRNFNKCLENQTVADEFVNHVKNLIDLDRSDQITEQILRLIISEQILIDSTWASKSYGKLRISYLTNFLKCCLSLGNLYCDNFGIDILRSGTINLIHSIRVENGLAAPSRMQKYDPRVKIDK